MNLKTIILSFSLAFSSCDYKSSVNPEAAIDWNLYDLCRSEKYLQGSSMCQFPEIDRYRKRRV